MTFGCTARVPNDRSVEEAHSIRLKDVTRGHTSVKAVTDSVEAPGPCISERYRFSNLLVTEQKKKKDTPNWSRG